MNKIIKTVKKEDKLFDSSALRRANANIEVYSPEELAHFGVMGMRCGDDRFVKSMNIPEDFLDIKDEEVAFVNMPDKDGDDQDENDDEG